MSILHEIQHRVTNVSIFEITDSNSKEWIHVGGCPPVECDVKPMLNRLKMGGNGSTQSHIHIRNILCNHLARVYFDGKVEHEKNLTKFMVLYNGMGLCVACWPGCHEILKPPMSNVDLAQVVEAEGSQVLTCWLRLEVDSSVHKHVMHLDRSLVGNQLIQHQHKPRSQMMENTHLLQVKV